MFDSSLGAYTYDPSAGLTARRFQPDAQSWGSGGYTPRQNAEDWQYQELLRQAAEQGRQRARQNYGVGGGWTGTMGRSSAPSPYDEFMGQVDYEDANQARARNAIRAMGAVSANTRNFGWEAQRGRQLHQAEESQMYDQLDKSRAHSQQSVYDYYQQPQNQLRYGRTNPPSYRDDLQYGWGGTEQGF